MSRPPLPTFHSDQEAERFVAEADLSDYDLSKGRLTTLAFREPPAEQTAEIKLPRADLEAAERNARSEGVPLDAYLGRLVHESLERLAS